MRRSATSQRGFTLVTTLFLLVVVSALAAYLVQLSTVQHLSSGLTVRGLQARYALTSGLEWALFELNRTGACPTLPASVTVEGFQVTLQTCNATSFTEGLDSYQLFDLTLSAARGSFGNVDYTQVRMRASVTI